MGQFSHRLLTLRSPPYITVLPSRVASDRWNMHKTAI